MRAPAKRFRADADRFREYGADGPAGALEACAVYCDRYRANAGSASEPAARLSACPEAL